jgi:dihydropyrimidinase
MTGNLLIRSAEITDVNQRFRGDILVENGRIKSIGLNLQPGFPDCPVIDADGLPLFPGGIDPHVHLRLDLGQGRYSADDFISGSSAALADGTTTFLDFVTPAPDEPLIEALKKRLAEAETSLCDYGLHFSVTGKKHSAEIKSMLSQGCPSCKIYTAYKNNIGINDDLIFEVMEELQRHEGLLLAHCENGEIIDMLREKLFNKGITGPEAHPLSRPALCESDAVSRIINMSLINRCPVYIVHVSCSESLKAIQNGRLAGAPVFGETCPQYLLLDEQNYVDKDFTKAASFVLSPPLRQQKNLHDMWQALKCQTIQTLATDHCPHTNESRLKGQKDFRLIPNGIAGIGHRMSLLYHFGINGDLISPEEFVSLTSANAAKIFGLYPRKGCICPGADADFVLFDPEASQTISAKTHRHNTDSCVYEGFELKGAPVITIQRGRIVFRDGQIKARPGDGVFQKRA